MSVGLTRFLNVGRSESFENASSILGYTEMGIEVVKGLETLGVDVGTIETIAYRVADAEPPITGKSLSEYQHGVALAVKNLVELKGVTNV